jgi:CBS domain-containing protein
MKASDVMTPNPTARRPEDDLKSVLEVMKRENVGIVPITEGNGEQRVVGVVTDRDIASTWAKAIAAPRRFARRRR